MQTDLERSEPSSCSRCCDKKIIIAKFIIAGLAIVVVLGSIAFMATRKAIADANAKVNANVNVNENNIEKLVEDEVTKARPVVDDMVRRMEEKNAPHHLIELLKGVSYNMQEDSPIKQKGDGLQQLGEFFSKIGTYESEYDKLDWEYILQPIDDNFGLKVKL